jgi:CubicO group peptidase (beta-lactamase class C family)
MAVGPVGCSAAATRSSSFHPGMIRGMTTTAPPRDRRLDAAIDDALAGYLANGLVPGVSVAVCDRTRTLRARDAGWRDIAARRPVDPDTTFEIGSIGKTFAAAIVLQLVDEGRISLDDPVVRHLPWFRVPRTGARITIHHLLSHTAGITAGVDGTPEAVAQVWRLRALSPGSAPGRRFHYSNVGYKALGLVVERLEGEPYPAVVRRRILEPLGMSASEPAITNEVRPGLAVGYGPLHDDRPLRAGDPLAPAIWLETSTADGSIVATAADLARFLRWLMVDPDGVVERMATPVPAIEAFGYGYGLVARVVDGRAYRGHGGGMVGYLSALQWDVTDGIGAVVLQNGPSHNPNELARVLIRRVRAIREGGDPRAELPADGAWEPEPEADAAATTKPTAAQAPVVGTYRSHDPWTPVFRVEARGEALWLVFPDAPDGFDDEQPLVPMARGWFRVGADRLGPERVRFDLVIEGRARRAWLSGWDYYRV